MGSRSDKGRRDVFAIEVSVRQSQTGLMRIHNITAEHLEALAAMIIKPSTGYEIEGMREDFRSPEAMADAARGAFARLAAEFLNAGEHPDREMYPLTTMLIDELIEMVEPGARQ